MTKVHPNAAPNTTSTYHHHHRDETSIPDKCTETAADGDAVVLTVWKKSLLFNCSGFTVFDAKGNLVFRVDNYLAGSRNNGEVVLMDAAGNPLLNIRRKRLSLGDNWHVYEGESAMKPRFSARKNINILNTKCLAHVNREDTSNSISKMMYEVEGSYAQRCCTVYDEKRRRVAEIKQKEATIGGVAFGVDVFRLIVLPEIDTSVAMAVVILLDQMFGSSKRFSPP